MKKVHKIKQEIQDNNPEHKCTICGRKLKNLAGLKMHMNYSHGDGYKSQM